MPKERVLQAHVERLVEEGALLNAINGRDEVVALFTASLGRTGIPAFPIDSLLRRAAIAAAAHVLGRLEQPRLVSADRDVSLDADDTLRPDLVLIDERTRAFLCVELKAQAQSERQALTELLAYEHEIRNHLPFISDLDLCFVLIATQYTTLLDHAVATHIAWYGKNILCIKATPGSNDGEWGLSVHIPEAWTMLGQTGIPLGAIQTQSLRFRPRRADDPDAKRTGLEAIQALEHAVRVAEYSGSHGFAVLWHHPPGVSELTIAVVDPRGFVVEAVRRGILPEPKTAFGREVLGAPPDGEAFGPPAALADLVHSMHRFLDYTSDARVGDVEQWAQLIARRNFVAVPSLIGFFGAPGRWVTDLLNLPGLWEWLPEMRIHGWSAEMARVAWPILMELLGQRVLPRAGEIDCRFTFDLGCHLAFALRVARIATRNAQMEAAKYWNDLWLDGAIREIVYRCNASEDRDLPAPPGGEFDTADHEKLSAFVEWIQGGFLRFGPVQEAAFRWGLSYPGGILPASKGDPRRPQLSEVDLEDARAWLDVLVKRAQEDPAPWDGKFVDALAEVLGMTGIDRPADPVEVRRRIVGLPDDALTTAIASGLPDVLDLGVEPVFHRLGAMSGSESVDWEQLRRWFKGKTVDGTRYPCLRIEPDGRFGVGFQDFPVKIWDVDYDLEVIVLESASGATFGVQKIAWEDVQGWFKAREDKGTKGATNGRW